MERTKIIIYLLAAVGILSACTTNLDDLKVNPEGINNPAASSFLNNSLYQAVKHIQYQGHSINTQLAQATVMRQQQGNNQIHRYQMSSSTFNTMWGTPYRQLLNFKVMRKLAEESGDANYTAIALTLESWLISNITDIYGDVPYTDASKGIEGNTTPKFDTQKQIYDSIFVNLERANSLYDLSKPLSGEDLLYNANVAANITKWQRFTNALALRLLMRVESKGPEYRDKLIELLANPTKYPLMRDNDDGATFVYTNVTPFLGPYYDVRDMAFNGAIDFSSSFIAKLASTNDPRLSKWATTVGGGYVGVPTGYPSADPGYRTGTYSTYQMNLKQSKYFGDIMQFSEQQFLLAEAVLKGYMVGNAKTYYDSGVNASLAYWGITDNTTFLNHTDVAYNGTLERIMGQKYIALFENGFQQWHEIRRTGYPTLVVGPDMMNEGKHPARLQYPVSAQLYNRANYDEVVNRIGGDNLNIKVWWME
ncbi:SusD/RagB family nutrient-binding outer membrane lipoprotein [Parapedobacter sp. SGR-10]|uniref:SusD/RagB family nutrient-binding outer membrane lipoprotein n=1 Tax=Parapedobacter sp. SGR-10 TaxID=2710879 RepID=UPI0013D32E00|nr:SusD/RagB family nutrient-binding outer membrane lipoprotein [Parapedobacter sp. SGR-10]NGF55064.1 SusD/RagB family nutrient-binding outer membrane lipoprotein [Parapedobacter sp. SGR-10]